MTHAALKDRKTHVAVLTELRNDVNPEGADPYGHMMAEALDAAIAALSAMEGEACRHEWSADPDFEDGIGYLHCVVCKVTRRHDCSAITSPPPQQAVGEREAFIRGYKHGACHYIGGNITEELHDAACWAVDHQSPDAGVFPTPSPGPQGGGEALATDEVLVAITRGEGYEDVAPELVAEDALGLKNPFQWRVVATPPAHQPGEVVKLTPELIEAGWHETFSTNNPFCPCDLKSFGKAARWAERALAPKGAGQ